MPTQAKEQDGLTMQRPSQGEAYTVKDVAGDTVATVTPPGVGDNSLGKKFVVKLHNVESDVEKFFSRLAHAFDHVVSVAGDSVKSSTESLGE